MAESSHKKFAAVTFGTAGCCWHFARARRRVVTISFSKQSYDVYDVAEIIPILS
jgi:hypothetical protein